MAIFQDLMKNVLMFGLEFEGGWGGSGLLLWILFGCLGHLNIFFPYFYVVQKLKLEHGKVGGMVAKNSAVIQRLP